MFYYRWRDFPQCETWADRSGPSVVRLTRTLTRVPHFHSAWTPSGQTRGTMNRGSCYSVVENSPEETRCHTGNGSPDGNGVYDPRDSQSQRKRDSPSLPQPSTLQ